MRRRAPVLIARRIAEDVRAAARERGLDAFWRGEPCPVQAQEALGWADGQAFLPLALWLPRPLLGPRSSAWRDADPLQAAIG